MRERSDTTITLHFDSEAQMLEYARDRDEEQREAFLFHELREKLRSMRKYEDERVKEMNGLEVVEELEKLIYED